MYRVQTEFRDEIMTLDQVLEFIQSTYFCCTMFDGVDGAVVANATATRDFLNGKYTVEVHQSVAVARRNVQPLCAVTVDMAWSDWVEAKNPEGRVG